MTQFYPPSESFKSAVEESLSSILPEKILDLTWNEYFYYFDTPAIIDASNLLGTWSLTSSGGSVGASASKLILNTGGTDGDFAGAIKDWAVQNVLRFDRKQRFRTAFQVNNISNTILYLLRGDAKSGDNLYYGFKVVGSDLQGVARNTGSEQTLSLMTISADVTYDLQAILTPQKKIIFSVRSSSDDKFFELGILTSGIPVGKTKTEFFSIYAETSATETQKQMTASYVEYIQKR